MIPSAKAAARACSGVMAAVMGLRWITRGGRLNGLLAVLCSVLYMASRQRHIKDGRRVVERSFAPGDRVKDRVQTTAAKLAAERVSREERRRKLEERDAEEEAENPTEPRRVAPQQQQQPRQRQQPAPHPPPREGRRRSRMAPLNERQEEEEGWDWCPSGAKNASETRHCYIRKRIIFTKTGS